MNKNIIALALAATCVFAAHAQGVSKDEMKAEKARIEGDYKAAKAKCDPLKDNAKDICNSEAKGMEKVAMAELDAKAMPGAKSDAKVAEVKADTAYNTAKEKCDDLKDDAKKVCASDAKAAHEMAKGQVKAMKK